MISQAYTKQEPLTSTGIPFFYYLFSVAAYATCFSYWQIEPIPLHVHIAAVLLAATGFIPLFIWQARGHKDLPMFELICLSYVLQFSTSVYTQPNQIIIFSRPVLIGWDVLYDTILYTEAGMIAMLIGYYATYGSSFIHTLPRIDLNFTPEQRYAYLRFAIVIGALVLGATSVGLARFQAINAITRVLGGQLYIAIVVLAYQVYGRSQVSSFWRNTLWITTIYAFLMGLITGLLENAFVIVMLLLLVHWHIKRRIPWLLLITGTILVLILNTAKTEYRTRVWYTNTQQSVIDKVTLWSNLFLESGSAFLNNQEGEREQAIQKALSRFDLIHKFAYVQTLTPSRIPHYNGKSYYYLFIAWVPRFLWPSKPIASDITSQMDVDYLLKPRGSSTTMGLGLVPEAYANFGLAGIILILGAQGIVFATLAFLLNGPTSEGGRGIYLTISIYFLNGIGSSAALLFGAIFQQIIAHGLVMYRFKKIVPKAVGGPQERAQTPKTGIA
ncbi:MAG: hypothetical protein R3E79_31910 [Caldilineaceae bacterium]